MPWADQLANAASRVQVQGLYEHTCDTGDELLRFFEACFANRSTSSTKLNDTSSRSHALFTINVHRVVVSVGDGVDHNLKVRRRKLSELLRL
jgi:Kinesin motor domain